MANLIAVTTLLLTSSLDSC